MNLDSSSAEVSSESLALSFKEKIPSDDSSIVSSNILSHLRWSASPVATRSSPLSLACGAIVGGIMFLEVAIE